MDKPFNTRLGFARREQRQHQESNADPSLVRPYGHYGTGIISGAAGFLVVLAVLIVALGRLPILLVVFVPAVLLGGVLGLILWLRHR